MTLLSKVKVSDLIGIPDIPPSHNTYTYKIWALTQRLSTTDKVVWWNITLWSTVKVSDIIIKCDTHACLHTLTYKIWRHLTWIKDGSATESTCCSKVVCVAFCRSLFVVLRFIVDRKRTDNPMTTRTKTNNDVQTTKQKKKDRAIRTPLKTVDAPERLTTWNKWHHANYIALIYLVIIIFVVKIKLSE